MCCSSARPDSARPRWRKSWRASLASSFRATSGPVIAKAGDLAALLTNLEERDVLFIDEIHRLNPAVEEILYPAMEDFQLDLIIGEGPAARSVKIDLAKFTLVGATTRAGLLTNPLRDRFGIPVRLNFYSEAELELIVNRGARVLGIGITADGANEIARRARGTPRIAGRLLRRVRDFASVAGAAAIDRAVADKALAALEVDAAGLDAMDRRYLIDHCDELRRRPGRRRDARRGPVGAARRHRGHYRALSDPVRLFAAHAARPADDRPWFQAISAWPNRRAIRRSSGCLRRTTMTEPGTDFTRAAVIADACAFASPPIFRGHLCNCSICAKKGFLHLIVPPEASSLSAAPMR